MLFEMLSGWLSFIFLIIMVLVGVAFLTLLERKILGYIQDRKGPNKVGFIGMLQPFSDAIKLFTKETMYPLKSNYLIYYFCPVVGFLVIFMMWMVIPFFWILINFNLGFLFLIFCLSLSVYSIMIAGWSSSSSYSLLGSIRSVAQSISYEVSLIFIFLNMIILTGDYNLISFYYYQKYCWFIVFMFPLFVIMFVSMLAETNRTPFDFAEGESELVSGFNVEYSSGGFALIFLAEYSSIIFMSFLVSLLFLGGYFFLYLYLFILFFCFMFIWMRGSLPRYRYDMLMSLCWKSFLLVSLFLIIFYFSLKIFLVLIN